ncbi:uncharacterized protein [Euwallacea similis]|uniref:uncharacterized protein isoform X1 n=1 Tax=Euwallacea similis TaxID=1736056 RepID=UPI00344E3282
MNNQASMKMSKRPFDTNQNKMSRNDRFVQMSQQEMLIEQKKREIQAKLEAKRRQSNQDLKDKVTKPPDISGSSSQPKDDSKNGVNQFSNDGSFLNQFKQLRTKKNDLKFKTFNKYKDKEREREKEKEKELEQERKSVSESDEQQESENILCNKDIPDSVCQFMTEITDKKITIDTSNPPPNHFTQVPPPPQVIDTTTGQALLPLITADFSVPPLAAAHINPSIPPPNVPLIPSNMPSSIPLIQPIVAQASELVGQLTTNPTNVVVPPPVASVQPQTVITQTHLFTTSTGGEQLVAAPPQVLLNVPPPQILPQTQIVITPQDQNVLVSAPASILTTVTLPPPVIAPHNITIATPSALGVRPPGLTTVELTSIPPPNPIHIQPDSVNTMTIPPSLQVSTTISTPATLELIPKPIDGLLPTENELMDTHFLKNVPPPNKNLPPPNVGEVSFMGNNTSQQANNQIASVPSSSGTVTRIPSLMSQRVLPPPGMGVNVPPPMILQRDVSKPPPNFALPNMNVPPPMIRPPTSMARGDVPGGDEFEAMANLARMVAECGPSIEEVVRQKKTRDPDLWFLFHKESASYRQYVSLVEQYKKEREGKDKKPDSSEMYEPEMALEEDDMDIMDSDVKSEIKLEDNSEQSRRDRKRKSRWGEKSEDVKPPITLSVVIPPVPGSSTMLSKVTRTDPGLLHYAMQTYGSVNLSEEDWKKAEDNYKIHLLYQDMLTKRAELERLQSQGKNKYEYDSDEETDGGTWEHKLRDKEMQATELWAHELTRQAEGKHHIGDFLPPEELKRFMEKSSAAKEGRQPNFSDYKEFKIKEDNIGFKMLQKLGWAEGQGLGQNSTGIVEPINKGAPRENTQGLGLNLGEATADEDEYESYRKRMMLAYRFRPNPLNNPRRPYY